MTSYNIPICSVYSDFLVFKSQEEYNRALKIGAFYLNLGDIPDFIHLKNIAENFYKNEGEIGYTGYKSINYSESVLGYEDRPEQVEQIQLEKDLWQKYFPLEVKKEMEYLSRISRNVIMQIFKYLNVSEDQVDKIVGSSKIDSALEYIILNNFRSDIRDIGFRAHTDSGFITLVYSTQRGLEGYIDGKWLSIDPIEKHLIVILGDAFNILTSKAKIKVNALVHRVGSIESSNRRFSVGLYIGPRFDMDLYRLDVDNNLNLYKNFKDFSIEKAAKLGYQFHSKV